MVSPLYDEAAQTAVELLTELGQALIVSRNVGGGGGAYDPETGTVADATSLVMPGVGIALDYSLREIGDGSQIRMEDQRIYMAPNIPNSPVPGDEITLADGRRYSVVLSRPLSPAGVILLHDVQARTL